ncbi:MAG: AAA family ATPase [Thermoplasmata archaeon]|nr:AAA family ATPase [Thermoplasmata archaeon]
MTDPASVVPPFVGRSETVEALHRRFEDARAGEGGVTLLVGDTGVGKSTLISGLAREIRARGIRLLIGHALPLDAPPPFALLRAAVESARSDTGLDSDASSRESGGPFLIGFAPRLAEGYAPMPIDMEARLREALDGTGGRAARSPERVLQSLAEQFLEFTRQGPTVLILEDLHRADEPSLAAIEFLSKELEDEPLWILGTSRTFSSLSSSQEMRLESFEQATRARRLVLAPMTSVEVATYLSTVSPSPDLSAEEVMRRFSETGGNPLLLQQLEHRASPADEGSRGLASSGSTDDGEAQGILEMASVLGPEFGFDLLLRAGGQRDEEQLTEAVDRLVGRGLLLERLGEHLAFPNDRVREEVYDRLSEERRQLLHRTTGENLEALGHPDIPMVYILARHFYLGRSFEKSIKYNRIAAEIAEVARAEGVAWDHLSQALESQRELDPDDRNAESALVLELARVSEELGRLPEAEAALRSFLDRESEELRLAPGRRATLQIFLARVLTDRGNLPAASELARKVLASPALDDQPMVRIGAHHQLGQVLYYEGKYPEALAEHTEEIRLASQAGNPLVLLRAQVWRVAALAMMGQSDQAIKEAREATAARDRLGSVRESAQAHLFFGDILADARSSAAQRQEAIVEYAKAIQFAEKAEDPRRIGWALYKTAELQREMGSPGEALANVQRACEILGRMGDQVGLSMSIKVRGQIAMDRREFDLAAVHLNESRRLLKGLDHTTEELDVLLRLAQLARARGDPQGAREAVLELTRRNLLAVRPDLALEFAQLREAVEEAAGRPEVPPPSVAPG